MTVRGFLLFGVLALFTVASGADAFSVARPVWPVGHETELNSFFTFRCAFDGRRGSRFALRVTAAYDYRATLNGKFVGFGPVRAPEDTFFVDEWPLAAAEGTNVVSIGAAGYNCGTYYFLGQRAFLQAEVLRDGQVIAATGTGDAFRAFDAGRIRRAPKYSSQRTFIDAWRVGLGEGRSLPLAVQREGRCRRRPVAYPDFAVNRSFRPLRKERLALDPGRTVVPAEFIEPHKDPSKVRFAVGNLETNPHYELQRYAASSVPGSFGRLAPLEAVTFAGDRNVAGFIGFRVKASAPCRIVISFDEILGKDGQIDFTRLECANVAEWRIGKPGTFELETFEPYAAKFIRIAALEGSAEISAPWVRTYASPLADRASFRASDPALERIFNAARESFRANAVDGFTDCPTRERACWTGDSFFTGRASSWLTGEDSLERLFLGNFLLTPAFDWSRYDAKGTDMTGAIPALYPGAVAWSNFIPNYMMWTVLEAEEYVARSGDRAFAEKARASVLGIVRFLDRFRNADGLLEKLPGWVFVEWSRANDLVQDVNYPSNMMYARMLEACANLYALPGLAERAQAIRREIVRQSWNGRWFCDNAVRQPDGSLKPSGECTETCQYCAFFFGTVTPESHADLWRRLLDEFGPRRAEGKRYPEIWPCNFIFGACERLELLSRAGRSRQILEETRDYFLTMADRTGTLWEHLDERASCCHGFCSIAAEYLFRDVLGVRRIDRVRRTVRVSPSADLPLDWCEGTLPVSPTETAKIGWRRTSDGIVKEIDLPKGWIELK